MIKILQITDLHLGADENYRLAGVDTTYTFNAVLERIQNEDFELIMVTGDISAEANISAYETFFTRIKILDTPVLWLPGNHDLMPSISTVNNAIPFENVLDIGDWRIIMLDSVVENHSRGCLGEEELSTLKTLLAENTQSNVLVSLHHQPINVGSQWLDRQKIEDADEFLSIIEADPKVRGVVWGHVHQDFQEVRNNRLFLATPSTCVQFKANSDEFALDDLYPGYRLLHLSDNGAITTEVTRVEIENFSPDVRCAGY